VSFEIGVTEFIWGIGLVLCHRPIRAIIKSRGDFNNMNKDFQDYVDLVVETAKAYKAAKADGQLNLADSLVIVPVLLKLPAALDGSANAFKDLSADDIKVAAIAVLEGAGENDGKLHVYVEQAFNILAHGFGIVDSVKKIMAA
jgi:hypothetical protein